MIGAGKRLTVLEIVGSPVGQRTKTLSFSISANDLNHIALPKLLLDNPYKVITVLLDKNIETEPLMDRGVSLFTFSDKEFVMIHSLPLHKLKTSGSVKVIDRREINGGSIKYLVKLHCRIHHDWEELLLFFTKLGPYLFVQGILWLTYHDVNICFKTGDMSFLNPYCRKLRPREVSHLITDTGQEQPLIKILLTHAATIY